MVFSPEAGYKFKVVVERTCSPQADSIWKLVFDLYRVTNGQEIQIVHVSFTAGVPVEQQAIQSMATDGVTEAQSDVLINDVHPAVKAIEGVAKPTDAQKKRIHDAMHDAVVAVEV